MVKLFIRMLSLSIICHPEPAEGCPAELAEGCPAEPVEAWP
jgi:hypothetical protein